jgi:hypothetical protein
LTTGQLAAANALREMPYFQFGSFITDAHRLLKTVELSQINCPTYNQGSIK